MEILKDIVSEMPWFGWVAIVAILGGVVRSIIAASQRHEQRLEMIKRGMDPSAIKDEE